MGCVTTFDHEQKVIFSTNTGVYVADPEAKQAATRILTATDVKQITVINAFQLLVILVHGNLEIYALGSALSRSTPAVQKLQTVSNNCSSFIEGRYGGKYLICSLEASMLSSTVQIFEVNSCEAEAADSETPAKSAVELHLFKELYLPYKASSMSLTESGLYMASKKGLDLVLLETLEIRPFQH